MLHSAQSLPMLWLERPLPAEAPPSHLGSRESQAPLDRVGIPRHWGDPDLEPGVHAT